MQKPPDEKGVKRGDMDQNELTNRLTQNEARLAQTEESVKGLSGRFESHEKYVHSQFSSFDRKLDSMEDSQRDSENRIIEKISGLQKEQSETGKTSWSLVVSICSGVFVVLLAIVGWGMSQAKTSAVNEAVAAAQYKYQQAENQRVTEWNRRDSDRGRENFNFMVQEIEEIRRNYFEHREGIELEKRVDDFYNLLTALEKSVSSIDTRVSDNVRDIALLEKYSLESIANRTANTAQLEDLQQEVESLRPIILEAANELGKLEPLTKGMGLSKIEGLSQKLETIEKLVNNIDQQGTRAGDK